MRTQRCAVACLLDCCGARRRDASGVDVPCSAVTPAPLTHSPLSSSPPPVQLPLPSSWCAPSARRASARAPRAPSARCGGARAARRDGARCALARALLALPRTRKSARTRRERAREDVAVPAAHFSEAGARPARSGELTRLAPTFSSVVSFADAASCPCAPAAFRRAPVRRELRLRVVQQGLHGAQRGARWARRKQH